jgi:hypothetical protein
MRMMTGRVAGLRGLEGGGELEGVARDDAIVVVAGGDERRRVGRAVADVVERRVRQERAELQGRVKAA